MEGRRKSTRASSRATSVDSKSKNEKEKDQAAASVDNDFESVSSGSSMTECKVVLDRLSSASFNTRSRLKSNLTVGNVAAMDSPSKGKKSKASESVASDDTGLSRTTRASTRLSTSQNTPKKDAKSTTKRAAAATPTRRSSRLVESIDLTNSPASAIPAKRTLRSNSVVSDDLTPASPSTRRSTRTSRLADSQGTPNKSRIESESLMTPGRKGRVSRLFTRQVQEIKEEEEGIDTISIIELDDDSSQSSPKPKSKKRAKSDKQTSSVESDASSKNIETVSDTTESLSEGKVLLVQTSTANLNEKNVAQSGDSETGKEANKSTDAVTETTKPSHHLNAMVDTSVVVEKTTIASPQPDQTLSNEKYSVEKKLAENVINDAIIVDESTLNQQKVDSINVSDLGKAETPKAKLETSMTSVIDESANNTPAKVIDVIEGSSTSKKKARLTKSPRADLDFMFQSTDNESLVSSKSVLTPKQMKQSKISESDQPIQVEKSEEPTNPSKNDLSLMNVTELVDSLKRNTSVFNLPSNQIKSPKTQTPSKVISEFADMDVTNINSPSTSITEKAAVTKELAPQQKRKTIEPINMLDSMNVTELVNSPKQDIQETIEEKQSPKPKQKIQTAESADALDLMNVTELVNSPKPKQSFKAVQAIEKQLPQPKTMSPKPKVQTTEPANTLDFLNVTELINSPKPKQREIAVTEKQSPKLKTSSKSATESVDMDAMEVNTPKSTPVSDKIDVQKVKTPKAKTPSKDSNEFGDMNVTKLVEEIIVKSVTPKKTVENVPASVPETVIQNAESDEIKNANIQIAKSPSSTKKTKTPKKSPLSSTLADQSINLNLEISKIYESLQSPKENTEPEQPAIFALPIDDGKTLDDTVEPMEVDQTQLGNMTSTSIDEQQDNQMDADDNNVSSVSVSSRKSVQIMTPKAVKSTSGLNRIGTPYPDKKEIDAALVRENEIQKIADRFLGYVKDYQERLKPLTESWNQSLKRVSTDKAGTSDMDTHDKKQEQVDEQPAKVAVPARNNWSVAKGLIDTDTESEPEPDNIPENENEGEQSEEESEHSSRKGLLDDEAEDVENYESGDSEDEEDRQYREENELKHNGIDIGSDDTDGSENEDDDNDSMNSFIVQDVKDSDADTHDTDPDDEPVGSTRRFSRILFEETSSDEEEQIVTVSMGAVHQEVLVFGQEDQIAEENLIIEGKKFETTTFHPSDDEQSVSKKEEKSDETGQVLQVVNESMTKSADNSKESAIENGAEIAKVVESKNEIIQPDESNESTISEMPKEISAKKAQPTTVESEIENITAPVVQTEDKVEPCHSKSDENEIVQESNETDVSTNSSKENEIAAINIPKKTNRISLPGIKPLPDSARKLAKEMERQSLGNIIPSRQVLTVSPARILHNKSSLLKKLTPKATKEDLPKKPVAEKSVIESDDIAADTTVKLTDSKVASSQEENNNKKLVKDSKVKRSSKKSETLSTTQSFDEQDNVVDDAVPCSSKSTMSVDSADSKKSKKQKRKFDEIEIKTEPSTPPRPVKYLNIIECRSGQFIEEPITPEKKDRLGFKVTPLTPINKAFRIEKLHTNESDEQQVNKSKKRKIVQIEEPSIVLPKPHWTVEQDNGQPKKRARKIMTGTTEMIIKPLNEKKRIRSARELIPAELQKFRENNLYRAGIPRQDSRSLLMNRMKRNLSRK